MREKLRFLGLDVLAETIAVAVAEPDGEVRSLRKIADREESIRKSIRRLGPPEHLRVCYEAGPTGFVLYWQLTQLGVQCAVAAPSLVPKKPGDRVKTDRRDALKLARSHRSGDLTAVWVPDEDSEALRDLVLQREAAKQDLSVYTRRVFASVSIADASFHSLRHTAASWLVMDGVDLYAVGRILGHKTPRMTQRCAHLSPGFMAAAVNKLDGVFAGSLPEPK